MKTFRVELHRDYLVEIEANNETEAKELTEFFLSDPRDASTAQEREKYRFSFGEIDLASNDASAVTEITDDANENLE